MPPSPGAGQGRGTVMDWARILATIARPDTILGWYRKLDR